MILPANLLGRNIKGNDPSFMTLSVCDRLIYLQLCIQVLGAF